MSSARLFQMLELLLEGDTLSAGELARALRVSPRTVYRDVDALSAAGFPVCTGGGVSLTGGYLLDRAGFSREEQRRLLAALREEDGADGGLPRLAALFRIPEDDWLRVDLSRRGSAGGETELFHLLCRAIRDRRAVTFTYDSSRGTPSRRTVLPARLACRDGAWTLVGWCTRAEAYRAFRLTRMRELDAAGLPFHRRLDPPEPGPAQDLPPLFRVEAVLRFSPALAGRVRDEFDPRCVEEEPGGSLLVRAILSREAELEGWLLSFGPGLEILAPDDLRQRTAALAEELARRHGEAPGPA